MRFSDWPANIINDSVNKKGAKTDRILFAELERAWNWKTFTGNEMEQRNNLGPIVSWKCINLDLGIYLFDD